MSKKRIRMKEVDLDGDLLDFLSLDPTKETNLTVRVKNGCHLVGINSVFEMLKRLTKKDKEISSIFGPKSLFEIRKYFKRKKIDISNQKNVSKIKTFYEENSLLHNLFKNTPISPN